MRTIFSVLLFFCYITTSSAEYTGGAQSFPQADLHRLTYPDSIRLFEQRNRELLAGHRVVESASADVIIAGQRPNPSLSINTSSIGAHKSLSSFQLSDKPVDTVLRVDQTFERGSKRELRVRMAQALL